MPEISDHVLLAEETQADVQRQCLLATQESSQIHSLYVWSSRNLFASMSAVMVLKRDRVTKGAANQHFAKRG